MGVGASLTVSLIHNQKLWGLIACHHSSPKLLPPYSRLATKLHAHFLTSQISNREAAKEYESSVRVNERLNPLIKALNSGGMEFSKDNKELYECLNADGLAIITEKKIYLIGKTPSKQQVIDLVVWLDTKTASDYYVTSRLTGEYPDALAIKDTASGVFFHSLYKSGKQGVLWFRGEREKSILWAGNPEKALDLSKDSLVPRKSFALWKQMVANTSSDWEKAEIEGGVRLATNLQNNIFLTYITQEEKKYRTQSLQLQASNKELKNFNYICSHDLQEPLRKIQILSDMLLEGETSTSELKKEEILHKINKSAKRASKQVKDLLDLSNISNLPEEMKAVNLDTCIENIKFDLELAIAEKKAIITSNSLGIIKGMPLQIELILKNLIGNALKFSKGQRSNITISRSNPTPQEIQENTGLNAQQEYVCITVEDDGIGFEEKHAAQIFDVFNRLNNRVAYEGNGIGLAIVKKIVDIHKGLIMAKSKIGEGATFFVYLPK
jgi:chemotaxis family two-component system sensor kinase Cph1